MKLAIKPITVCDSDGGNI